MRDDGGLEVWQPEDKIILKPVYPRKKARVIIVPEQLLWTIKRIYNGLHDYALFNKNNEWVCDAGNSRDDFGVILADLLSRGAADKMKYRWRQWSTQRDAPKVYQEKKLVQFHWFEEGDNVFAHMLEHPRRTLEECLFVARQEGFEVVDGVCVKR
jgi:hypothetical protein